MRTAFIEALRRLARTDRKITLVVGDLGFGVVEGFANEFPNQFVNAGVAEQSMTGIAAGLAMSGRTVFTYSIANFPTFRCLEQIRNDVCYHGLNVKVVSVGAGFAYGALGYSHHGLEDLAVMSAMPGMTVVAPGDPTEAAALVEQLASRQGPAYLRLGKAGERVIHLDPPAIEVGRATVVREGADATIMATGSMLALAVDAASALVERGVDPRVISMHTLRPLDTDAISAALHETGGIVTVEEHGHQGGLGESVARTIVGSESRRGQLRTLAVDSISRVAGSQEYLRASAGLTVEAIIMAAMDIANWRAGARPQRHAT